MDRKTLHVALLETTRDPLSLIYAACRQCYSSGFAGDLFNDISTDVERKKDFVKKVVSSGHESPLEHVKFTFAVEGVSRALTHQLVRHRLASYSQQSQRYVREDQFAYIVPPSIANIPQALECFDQTMFFIRESYKKISALLKSVRGDRNSESVYQDARFVLPQAAETKIVITMNCRELLHFFKHRCCLRAQWEIRALAEEMLKICRSRIPEVFPEKAAKCDFLGYCPEGKFSCGRQAVKKQIC